jgi:hypothetical protein
MAARRTAKIIREGARARIFKRLWRPGIDSKK